MLSLRRMLFALSVPLLAVAAAAQVLEVRPVAVAGGTQLLVTSLDPSGLSTTTVLVPPGGHKYQVFCVNGTEVSNQPASSGTVSVLRDAGTARIPRTAATTLVDTDGRNYTVLYQNILPKISVRWPKAPAGGSYTITVSSPGGKTESHSSSTAAWP